MKSLKSNYIKRFMQPGKFYKDPKTNDVYKVDFVTGKGNFATLVKGSVPHGTPIVDLSTETIDKRYFKREKDNNRLHNRWLAQKECLRRYVKLYGNQILNDVEKEYTIYGLLGSRSE